MQTAGIAYEYEEYRMQLQTVEIRALDAVAEGFRLNALKLPSLPEVTAQVRAVAADPRATVEDLAQQVVRDAALTARLIRVANSPLLRGRMEVRTLSQAITRLGFYYVRDLVTALALEHAFEPCSNATRQLQQRISRRSRDVAAVSQVLARHCTGLAPEQAMLAGLLHFIGALPLLAAVEDEQLARADSKALFAMIEKRHAEIGGRILRHWHFPEEIAAVPEAYLDATRVGDNMPDYADIVAVACLLSKPLEQIGQEIADWGDFAPARRLGLENAAAFYSSDEMQGDLQKCMGMLN